MGQNRYLPGKHYPFNWVVLLKRHTDHYSVHSLQFVDGLEHPVTQLCGFPGPACQVVWKIFSLLLWFLLFGEASAPTPHRTAPTPHPLLQRQWMLTSFHLGPAARLGNRCCIVNTKKKTNSPLLCVLPPPSPSLILAPWWKWTSNAGERRGRGSNE